MCGIEFYNSGSSHGLGFATLTPGFERWAANMKQDGTLKAAMDDLRAKLEFHRRKAGEIETALRALESVASDNGSAPQTVVMHQAEFANAGIADAAVIMIRRAKRPLHVKEIAEGLQAGGYVFRTDNPLGSVAPVLYMAAKSRKDLVKTGKNTYSIRENQNQAIQ